MGNYKIPIIAAAVAVIAVVVTIIILTSGTESGLYVENITGSVSVTGESGNGPISAELKLTDRDIITVGGDSSATLVYKGKDNSENNYIILGANTQAVVSGKWNGSGEGEIFLNRGTAICNLAGESKGKINIRTSNAMVYAEKTVTIVSNYQNESNTYTDVFDFMGNSRLALYDETGHQVNEVELLLETRAASIVTSDRGPFFEYLNLEFSLSVLTANDLRHLITIAQTIEGTFPYSLNDLTTALENAPDAASTLPADTTAVTSEPIETASPIDTTGEPPAVTTAPPDTQITLPPVTAAPPRTTAPASATAPPATSNDGFVMPSEEPDTEPLTVILEINGDEQLLTVPYGGSIPRPADPVIPGYTFTGWSSSFENITVDKTISAILTPNGAPISTPTGTTTAYNPYGTVYHTVTIIIQDQSRTIQVPHGTSAGLAETLNIEGYRFLGWDRDFKNITSDCTIRAVLEPISTSHNVTFIIDGSSYIVSVQNGGTVTPPFYPPSDRNGRTFLGWDKSLNNITADTTITAVYENPTVYTVTFIIEGRTYPVSVNAGETAIPPFIPEYNASGYRFVGWDKPLTNIQSNQNITAVFQ
jgi:hypothetical protein